MSSSNFCDICNEEIKIKPFDAFHKIFESFSDNIEEEDYCKKCKKDIKNFIEGRKKYYRGSS